MTPRIPPLPPEERDERTEEVLAATRATLDAPDLNIFATLARHPRLLKRWAAFGGTLLVGGELDPRERELLILRTGWNCQSEYEWGQHVRLGKEAGLTDVEITDLTKPVPSGRWTPDEAALLDAADELHEHNRIQDGTWATLRDRYGDAELIEICMVVGQYHLVAFTLNSLGVEREPGVVGFP